MNTIAPGIYVDGPTGACQGTLVCAPGVNSGAYIFEGAVAALAEHWRVVRLATPGSEGVAMPLPFSVKAYGQYIAKIATQQRTPGKPLVLLGHSLGGYAVQEAARLVEDVARVILVSTSRGQPDTSRDLASMQGKLGRNFWEFSQLIGKDPLTAMKPLFGDHFVRQDAPRYAAFIAERGRHLPPSSGSAAQLAAGGAFSSRGWVSRLTMPALVIHGLDDILVTAESGRALAAALPHGTWLPLHGVGHHPPVEHEKFWDYVTQFCQGHPLGEPVLPKMSMWDRMRDFLGRSG
jgi:pimeloyl-ACP methyl ester carboxylesterase